MPLLLTIGARLSDSLPLFESVSSGGVGEGGCGSGGGGGEGVRTQAMAVLRRVDAASPARMAIDAGPHALAYLVEDGVVLLALAERAYPRKLVFAYLAECHRALAADMAAELGPAGARAAIDTASKPYAFMKFERTLHRIAREFADPSSKSNTAKLADELQDIQHIMRKNIQEVLDRGEKLEREGSGRGARVCGAARARARDLRPPPLDPRPPPLRLLARLPARRGLAHLVQARL